MQDPPPPPLLAPAAALLQRLAPYGLTVPDAWLQPRIVLLDVGARARFAHMLYDVSELADA